MRPATNTNIRATWLIDKCSKAITQSLPELVAFFVFKFVPQLQRGRSPIINLQQWPTATNWTSIRPLLKATQPPLLNALNVLSSTSVLHLQSCGIRMASTAMEITNRTINPQEASKRISTMDLFPSHRLGNNASHQINNLPKRLVSNSLDNLVNLNLACTTIIMPRSRKTACWVQTLR